MSWVSVIAEFNREWMVRGQNEKQPNMKPTITETRSARIANNTPARGSCKNCGETLRLRPCLNCKDRESIGF